MNSSELIENIEKNNFVITLSKEEFERLVITKIQKDRTRIRFKDGGEWGDVLVHKIWSQTPVTYAFNFKSHYLSNSGESGSIHGTY